MRRLLKHGIAWTLSTAAAGTVSWWGVHTVMTATAYTPPPALPVAQTPVKADPESTRGPDPRERRTTSPAPTRSAPAGDGGAGRKTPADPSTSPAPSAEPTGDDSGTDALTSPSPTGEPGGNATTNAKGWTVDGGRVTFDMQEDHAELISATPHPGWRMQVWKHPQWIRVSFTDDDREIAVFCSWYQHPPLVEIEEK